ncbi:MAG TPA: hypothetical protein VN840_17225 [Streptosporangiaceae bacterium]|nr:hypothetical protein [Streptosporangiaceae bacterium]
MKSSHTAARWITGCAIAAGAAGAVLAFAGIETPLRAPLVLVILAIAPALAVASLLPGLDPFGRLVVAGTAALVINAGVATVMLVAGSWSPRAGLAIVLLISAMLAAIRLLPGRRALGIAARGISQPRSAAP